MGLTAPHLRTPPIAKPGGGLEFAPRADAAKGTHNAVLDLVRSTPDCKKVLDIPCGEGAFTQVLLREGYDTYSADCLHNIRVETGAFVDADMNKPLPFADAEFDAIVCIDGIEHIENPYGFAKESARIIRKGGSLILSTPNISSLRSRWRWLMTGFHNKGKVPLDETDQNPTHHVNLLEFHKIRYMLHREGFRITDITTNRSKWPAFLFAPLIPLSYLLTRRAFQKEIKRAAVRGFAPTVLRQMFSWPVLFGETLILRAVRD